MKKFVLLLLVSFICTNTISAQYPIDKKASIKRIDEFQSKFDAKTLLDNYLNKFELGFTLKNQNWIYVLSYEPKENEKFKNRYAFLYKRKLNDIGNWKKASINPIFEHVRNKTYKISFDNNTIQRKEGTSAVERLDTDYGTNFVMFVGINIIQDHDVMQMTHFVHFYPLSDNSDGSTTFGFREWGNNFTKFKYTGRNGNVFHDKGKKLKILFDYRYDKENEKPMPYNKRIY